MMRIGNFAEIFSVSIKTIRFYEEKGLLHPAKVDIYTGYRYYDEQNIEEMKKILILKELGLPLKEIIDFDFNQTTIDKKIKEYEQEIYKIQNNIHILSSFLKKEEIKNMKPFTNDEYAIGKWQLLGVSQNEEEASKSKYYEDDFNIKELYLMPNGQEYWVIKWTKGYIYINRRACPYELNDNKMYLKILDAYDDTIYKVATYEKIDDKVYTEEEIRIKDDTSISFIQDDKIQGFWQSVDFINTKSSFNPKSKKKNLYLNKIVVTPDQSCIAHFTNNSSKAISYSKGFIIDLCIKDTLSAYELKTVDDEEFMIIEWKSGDYIYGRIINGYYVLKKMK